MLLQTLATQTEPEVMHTQKIVCWPSGKNVILIAGSGRGYRRGGRRTPHGPSPCRGVDGHGAGALVASTHPARENHGPLIRALDRSRPDWSWHEMPRLWVAFPSNSLPVVWARLAQHRFRVLVDTGAARSLIAPAVASSLGSAWSGLSASLSDRAAATVPLVEVIGGGVGQMELPPFQAGILIWGRCVLEFKRSLGSTPLQGVVSRSIFQKDACIHSK